MSKKVKVVMQVSIAGNSEPRYGLEDFGFSTGQVVELHPDLARAWIAGGLAKAIDGPTEPETTSLEPPETAVLPEGKPKRVTRETAEHKK